MSAFRGGAIHPGRQVSDHENDNVSIDDDNYGLCPVNQSYVQDVRSVMMKNAILDGCGIESNKGIKDAGSTADIRMLWPWSALVCLGLL